MTSELPGRGSRTGAVFGLLDAVLRDSMEPAYAARAKARADAAPAASEALTPVAEGRPGEPATASEVPPAAAEGGPGEQVAGGWRAVGGATRRGRGRGVHPRPHPPRTGAGHLLGRSPGRGPLGRLATVAGLAVVAIGVVSLRQGADVPEAAAARTSLVAEVTSSTATVDDLRKQVATLTAQDDAATDAALARNSSGAALQARVDALTSEAAESAVTGKGLVLTLTDTAPDVPAGATASTAQVERGRVTDRDLQQLVNTVLGAGGTAVDIGGIRLTTTTPVRSAGETVLVGLQPVASPYVVHVVGPTDRLQTALSVAAVGQRLRAAAQLGGPVLTTTRPQTVTVAAAATVSLRFAAPVG